jgi:PPK2 family polyphosphate:nucleotide phosphotransferase
MPRRAGAGSANRSLNCAQGANMKLDIRDFRVSKGGRVDLGKRPTRVAPVYTSKAHYEALLQEQVGGLANLQEMLYADNRYALLVIFQAMDAAGKDGAIKHVMSGINPQGCRVYSFKHPSAQELEHDYLWRIVPGLPERGHIGVFNRSYYEEVLIARVHPEILRAEGLPDSRIGGEKVWKERYRSMLGLERHLHVNGTRIVKLFLHVSKEEQRKRLLARIDEPEKNWKFSETDIRERGFWKDYMKAYEDCLAATSTREAPWHVVPADDKLNARLIISRILVESLRSLDLAYPKVDAKRRRELQAMRGQLAE